MERRHTLVLFVSFAIVVGCGGQTAADPAASPPVVPNAPDAEAASEGGRVRLVASISGDAEGVRLRDLSIATARWEGAKRVTRLADGSRVEPSWVDVGLGSGRFYGLWLAVGTPEERFVSLGLVGTTEGAGTEVFARDASGRVYRVEVRRVTQGVRFGDDDNAVALDLDVERVPASP